LLTGISAIRGHVQNATDVMPLQRLFLIDERLGELLDETEANHLRAVQNNGNITSALTAVYRQLSRIIADNDQAPRRARQPERAMPTEDMCRFLQEAEERGWTVRSKPERRQERRTFEEDGFWQSINFIRRVAASQNALLKADAPFGLVRGPLLLLRFISDATLHLWTKEPHNYDVYVVFGRYALITNVLFVGVAARLVCMGGDECTYIDMDKFTDVLAYTAPDIGTDDLMPYPRPIRGHYYCPILSVGSAHRRHFAEWDMPTTN